MEVPEKTCSLKRNVCRFLKMAIFILCSAGFGYQTDEFLRSFYKYPTVLNMVIENLEEFPTPALTFCSRFLFDIDKYCRQYRERCKSTKEMESFCADHPGNCGENKTDAIIPVEFPRSTYSDECPLNVSEVFPYNSVGQDIEGPFSYSNHFTAYDEVCYTLGTGLEDKGLRNITIAGSRRKKWGEIEILFTQRENIFFTEEDQPLGTLYIHSPFISSKKFTKSRIIEAGHDYNVHIHLKAESLLPFPYETNCEDYVALWKKNNMTGPISRDMCEHVCLRDESIYFKSGFWGDAFGAYEDRCNMEIWKRYKENDPTCKCWGNCKDECLKLSYDFKYFTSISKKRVPGDNKAKVIFYIESNKVPFTYHRPQYRDEDLFSYIGGLLGCWLGMSLWTLSGMLSEGCSVLVANAKKYKKCFHLP